MISFDGHELVVRINFIKVRFKGVTFKLILILYVQFTFLFPK